MRKIFISQPFSGWTKEQVVELRRRIIVKIIQEGYEEYGKFEIINSVDCFDIETPLAGLAEAIRLLEHADIAYFPLIEHDMGVFVYSMSRGCDIEYKICKDFNIPTRKITVEVLGTGNEKPEISKDFDPDKASFF